MHKCLHLCEYAFIRTELYIQTNIYKYICINDFYGRQTEANIIKTKQIEIIVSTHPKVCEYARRSSESNFSNSVMIFF